MSETASRFELYEAALRRACVDEDVDRRRIFVRLRERNGAVRLECSDAAALQRLADILRRETGAALETSLLPAAAAAPHAAKHGEHGHAPSLRARLAWVAASVADVRRQPAHGAEQVTQALQGEELEPLLHEEGWLLVRLPDGYIGWIRDWHVELCAREVADAHRARADARVALPWTRLHAEPNTQAPVCGETLLGTHVFRVQERNAWIEIELPGGRRGWVMTDALRSGVHDWPCTADSILRMIAGFSGVPYVWGGRSPKGFDCSGLVQFVFGLHGVRLPRDSDQQFEQGAALETPAAGDLLFFGSTSISHVAVALDASAYLHARGEVRRNSLDPGSPEHDAELASIYRGARRVLTMHD